jgi:hypothetical protein
MTEVDVHASQDKPTGARAAAVSVLAVLLVVVTLGCGDDGSADAPADSTTTVVDRDAWVRALDADCAELNEDYQQLAEADPSNREEAIAHARTVEEFAAELDGVLDGSGVPDDQRADAARLSELVDLLAEAASGLADAAEAGDATAAAAAAQQLADAGAAINPVAADLGVPACGGF